MPNYRRIYVPGGTYFFTVFTYQRQPIFKNPKNISLLRKAIVTAINLSVIFPHRNQRID